MCGLRKTSLTPQPPLPKAGEGEQTETLRKVS